GRTLPMHLDRGEVDFLFAEAERRAEAGGFKDTRDLAILELFYSTGVRLAELAGLNEQDVDLVSDQVKVRGKGRKERIVPLGRHAERRCVATTASASRWPPPWQSPIAAAVF